MPFRATPGFAVGPVRGVMTDVAAGDKVTEAEMFCAEMVLGLSLLGKVPTAWSGRPLAVSDRSVLLQDQVAVAVALTEAELLKALVA